MDALTLRDNAKSQLEQIKTIESGKDYLNKVKAVEIWAKAEKKDAELQNIIAEQKIRTQRVLGNLIREGQERGEIAKAGGDRQSIVISNDNAPKTLSEIGITRNESHIFQIISDLPNEKFESFIQEKKQKVKDAVSELTTSGVYAFAKREKNTILKKQIKENNPLPEGFYDIIYADPPWQYENSGFGNSAESNYPTMPLEKICDLPIQDLCTDKSVLFLWATNPLLKEAFDVMEAWGFTYKTNFAWIKDKARGWAWWAKSKHELILVGVRPKSGTPAKNYDSAFMEKRENKHSKKPEFVYEMIEDMFPDSKYIELFARNTRKGWDGWGNQL